MADPRIWTQEEIDDICQRYDAGVSSLILSQEYKTSPTKITTILRQRKVKIRGLGRQRTVFPSHLKPKKYPDCADPPRDGRKTAGHHRSYCPRCKEEHRAKMRALHRNRRKQMEEAGQRHQERKRIIQETLTADDFLGTPIEQERKATRISFDGTPLALRKRGGRRKQPPKE